MPSYTPSASPPAISVTYPLIPLLHHHPQSQLHIYTLLYPFPLHHPQSQLNTSIYIYPLIPLPHHHPQSQLHTFLYPFRITTRSLSYIPSYTPSASPPAVSVTYPLIPLSASPPAISVISIYIYPLIPLPHHHSQSQLHTLLYPFRITTRNLSYIPSYTPSAFSKHFA